MLDVRMAVHEAGHAVVAWRLGLPVDSIVAGSAPGRIVEFRLGTIAGTHLLALGDGDLKAGKRQLSECRVIVALAGMAAGKVFMADGWSAALGAEEDWNIAKRNYRSLRRVRGADAPDMAQLYARAEQIVVANRDLVKRIASELLHSGELPTGVLKAILDGGTPDASAATL